jgi:hypothetical protein
MKKLIMALVLIGGASWQAAAQSDSKYAQNYKVCRDAAGSYVVCDQVDADMSSESRVSSFAATRKTSTTSVEHPCINITDVPAGSDLTMKYRKTSRVRARFEGPEGELITEPKAPAYGNPSPQYDGPDVNAKRNLNYGSGQPLPPSTGEIR